MKVKVNEATKLQLNWMVAKCWWHDEFDSKRVCIVYGATRILNNADTHPSLRYMYSEPWEPTTNWAQGGPIIEREHICLLSPTSQLTMFWVADIGNDRKFTQFNHMPLVAAMRCYVASKLGDEVEVPEELK